MSRASEKQIETQRREEAATFNADDIQRRVTALEERVKRIQTFGSVSLACWPWAWNASAGSLGSFKADLPGEALDGLEAIIAKREGMEGALARTLGIAA